MSQVSDIFCFLPLLSLEGCAAGYLAGSAAMWGVSGAAAVKAKGDAHLFILRSRNKGVRPLYALATLPLAAENPPLPSAVAAVVVTVKIAVGTIVIWVIVGRWRIVYGWRR